MATENGKSLLEIRDLNLHFQTTQGVVQAVDKVDFDLGYNDAIVILGESGCGKTSLARAILRLLPRNVDRYDGKVRLGDMELMGMGDEEFRKKVRWVRMSMVPQAAMNALNPVLKVGDQVAEPLMIHAGISKENALSHASDMFRRVGVPVDFLNRYAFELSGGMRQRVAIAMALVTTPEVVLLDEPTSALDVLTQTNIFNLLKRVKQEFDVSFILITHDIATSSELAERVAVMYAGQIVEVSDAGNFFEAPLHPYSQKLMASVPRLRGTQDLEFIPGKPPSLIGLKAGCRFAPRCSFRFDKCDQDPPITYKGDRLVRCWLHAEG
ncbi:MAG TPA: dipeptide/oligopeptide/nickel ABC transporter ATP-binding protein [Chloroflexi bacterium]|nr:dipeptide/oligopeptide/nickel ABC transporter ATP-binding protein [Chloroflexota bacterium]